MRRNLMAAVMIIPLLTLGGAAVATANTVAAAFSLGDVNSVLFPNDSLLGWEFSVNNVIRVDELGMFDQSLDGFATGGSVGLYDSAGSLLPGGSMVVPTGSPTPLIGNFRYVSLAAPIVLAPGDYSIYLYAPAGNTDQAVNQLDPGSLITPPEITYKQRLLTPDGDPIGGLPATLPDSLFVNLGDGLFGPNFRFEPRDVPEPTTVFLLGCGLVGLGVRRRLH